MKKKLVALLVSCAMALGVTSTFTFAMNNDEELRQREIIEELKDQTPENFTIHWDKEKDKPRFISGRLSTKKIIKEDHVLEFLKEKEDLFKISAGEFKIVDKNKDKLKKTHYKVKMEADGIELYGKELGVHVDNKGYVYAVNGKVKSDLDNTKWSSKVKLSEKEALRKAEEAIGIHKKKVFYTGKPESKLYLYEFEGKTYVTYLVEIRFINPYGANWQVFVNAENGKIVDKFNAVDTGREIIANGYKIGSGTDCFGNKVSINTFYEKNKNNKSGKYYLADFTKPTKCKIFTCDLNNEEYDGHPGGIVFSGNNEFHLPKYRAAVSAHINIGKVYDYYYKRYGRNSYDDKGTDIVSTVHAGEKFNNAFWNGFQMVYGDGDGVEYENFSAALDVVAHEFTHAVTQHTSGLEYRFQSGALNEAMSDIMGIVIEGKKGDWLIGEDCFYPENPNRGLRDMENPEKEDQPAHMVDYVNLSMKIDNGGVHINSGIILKAASTIGKKLGKATMGDIFYRANCIYYGKKSDFCDARIGAEQATIDMFGYGSKEHKTVANAFAAVGIGYYY